MTSPATAVMVSEGAVPPGTPAPGGTDQVIAREFIAAGMCPICEAGPFAVVALHTQRIHDVDRFALRHMLGVFKNTSICDEAHSAQVRRRARRQWTPEKADEMRRRREASARRRELSEAAKERNRTMSRANRDKSWAALQDANLRRAQEVRSRHQKIRERWDAGLSFTEIAAEFGVRPKTVSFALDALGVDVGKEALRRRKNWSKESLDRGRATWIAQLTSRRDRRVQRYETLGSNWAALCRLAAEEGLSRRHMAAYLRKHDVHVPDGRSVS